MTQKFRHILRWGKIGAYIVTPIFLFILPSTYFDHGQSISLFELIGVEGYYSKGITKACMHMLHFDFKGAAEYNKLVFVVLPLIAIVWIASLIREIRILLAERKSFNNTPNGPSPTEN